MKEIACFVFVMMIAIGLSAAAEVLSDRTGGGK